MILRPRYCVPCMPEDLHLLGTTEGNTDVCIQGNRRPITTLFCWKCSITPLRDGRCSHHKIGMRIDRFKLTSRGLIKEFLTIVHFCSTEPFNPSLSGASSLSNDCIDSYYRLLRLPVPPSVTHLPLALPYLQGEPKMRSRSKVFDPFFCNSFRASFRLACVSRRLS
jgi:hypothetical protein